MKKVIKSAILVLIIFCFQCCSVLAKNDVDYFKKFWKIVPTKYRLSWAPHPIKLKDGRLFFYDGLDVILFDPKTDTFRKSLTTPTLDGKPVSNKNKILLPDGNVLIFRHEVFPTWDLKKKILKTLKLTHVRNIHNDIFPYIKAYPDLYDEYLRQKEINERYSVMFIYNPITEKIYFTKCKTNVGDSVFVVVAKNKKIYAFYKDLFLQGKLINEYKNVPIEVYDVVAEKKEILHVDFNGCGNKHAYLRNAISLNNGNILLIFTDNVFYLYNTEDNIVVGPKYIGNDELYFLPLEDGRILVSSGDCQNLGMYSGWTTYPEEFIMPLSDDKLKKELDLIDKNTFYTCKDFARSKVFRHRYTHPSMFLNDKRLLVWEWDDLFRNAKIYTPKK